MIIENLKIPCPDCLTKLEMALAEGSSEAVCMMRSVFCDHRNIALIGCVTRGTLVYWHMLPAHSAEEWRDQLESVEKSLHAMVEQDAARQNTIKH